MRRWTPTVHVLDGDAAGQGVVRVRREPVYRRLNHLIDEALQGYEAPTSEGPVDIAGKRRLTLPRAWSRKAS